MDRETVAAGLMEAERELQQAQRALHYGGLKASVRYGAALARLAHLEHLAVLLINMSDPAATLTG